jgi:ribonuclease E
VLMPNNPRAGGVSRRIMGDERNQIRDALAVLDVPEDMGLIVRTAGVGKNPEELQWDLNYLLQMWEAIEKASAERPAPFLIYQESNVIIRAIRDYLRKDINEILIDNKATYDKAREFMELVMPHNLGKVKLYEDKVPLFTRYQIESQIETAFKREVRLPSGGAIVIDHTEALISIDINSARATKGSDIEETALNTNREAAEEVARQLRLRDLGGLIVIDFIDMSSSRNQREVENTLRDALKMDRARVQVGRISRFGLLEMSRQRLRPSLGESSQIVCPRCQGQGNIRGTESLALSILRILEEDAMKEQTARIVAQVPVNVATFLLNEKRQAISDIETRQRVKVLLIPNPSFETPHYEIQRERLSDLPEEAESQASYDLAIEREEAAESVADKPRLKSEEPAVKGVVPAAPVPQQAQEVASGGFIKRLWSNLVGSGDTTGPAKAEPAEEKPEPKRAPRRTRSEREGAPARSGSGRRRQSRRGEGGRRSQDADAAQQESGKPGRKRPAAAAEAETAAERKPARQEAQPGQEQESSRERQEGQRSSRRGRRGGRRRRRDSGEQGEGDTPKAASATAEQGEGARQQAPQAESAQAKPVDNVAKTETSTKPRPAAPRPETEQQPKAPAPKQGAPAANESREPSPKREPAPGEAAAMNQAPQSPRPVPTPAPVNTAVPPLLGSPVAAPSTPPAAPAAEKTNTPAEPKPEIKKSDSAGGG